MHNYVKLVYKITKLFPRDEQYGVTAQTRRAAMSVILNYIEGYARRKNDICRVYLNFIETSYGSLKESEYLNYFSYTESYMTKDDYSELLKLSDRIGGMLYGAMNRLKQNLK